MTTSEQISDPKRQTAAHATGWLAEAGGMVRLATPLALTQLSFMALVLTDGIMMGRLGPDALAAGSLAGHFYGFVEFFSLGLLAAVAPMIAHHLGARRYRQVRRTVRQGFWAAIILAAPATLVIWQIEPLFLLLGQQPDIVAAGAPYLQVMTVGLLPGYWFMVLAEFLAAHSRPRATLIVALGGILLNALLDYALMFGHFGSPALGLVGAGLASAFVNVAMFLALAGVVLADRRFRRYRLLARFWRADWPELARIFRLGLPIGITQLSEIGAFLAAALLMGLLGTTALAAHAIAVQCVAVIYMIPLGIGQAATVRVGYAVGAGDRPAARRAGWTALALSASFALLPIAGFLFLGRPIVGLFLGAPSPATEPTATLAVSLLAFAALFHLVDALQVTTLGVLRGYKDTRVPMLIAIVCYLGLGLCSAWYFGIAAGHGSQAIWTSLAAALLLVCLLYIGRFMRQARRLPDPATA
ncbi:MATE family efflux transporter [Oceanibacterium hippocampi]|uniref:Multidrug-efflux transporter n=1 Tax=Oceanibacterium hippocampi TaxID=745714 RepID=A0A1Y5S978_9PROT|nr:MATE family efflux transporter [Oceanibacterium hippocampi]SLN35331.1 Multidrug resistance protein NorM [Oceanibacterium hippocampi]